MSKQFTVLVVDDEESTRRFLHSVLTAEGYDCQLADSLEGAEVLLRQSRIDLALVDLYLGTANGLNVLDLLKQATTDRRPAGSGPQGAKCSSVINERNCFRRVLPRDCDYRT